MDAGILIARVLLGLAIGAHGTQKLFGWFGGYGPRGAGAFDTLWEPRTAGVAIAVAVPLALVNVALRRPTPATKAHA
jgi:uncharacterized membrane protein YphA (DoxX/SURF4 family)